MLSYEDAERIARKWVHDIGVGAVLDLRSTIRKPYGWVFFYESRQFLEGGDDRFQMLGNAPFIVNRFNGTLTETGTANRVEVYLAEYESSLPESQRSAPER